MATFPERGDALTAFTEFGESLIELLERVRGTGTGEAVGEKILNFVRERLGVTSILYENNSHLVTRTADLYRDQLTFDIVVPNVRYII